MKTEAEKVERCINSLSKLCLVKHSLPPSFEAQLRKLFNEQNYTECIQQIKLFFNLPLTIRIEYKRINIPDKILSSAPNKEWRQQFINSMDDACQDVINQHVPHPMEVVYPDPMPIYGSQLFDNLTIRMIIRWNFRLKGFEMFVCCAAHEMSHIVLNSTGGIYKDSEKATDIFSMMNGFADLYRKTRKNEEILGRLGYLTDIQFLTAYQMIEKMSRKNSLRAFMQKFGNFFRS